ncbi:TIGR01620 family protein [Hoeflea sp. IMCC20628]|uniref:YcjF family protein n=1 Tax=Hoeflea sp. IMCC20628 TaxID=1620421 RepID=UPI00063A914E|nr:TIGR01620 family protein [Hoeflea sp. IMCC20628]AKI00278.1 TIGR01620 family protein [Hoeflea sp. IMCC20628]
MTDHDASDPVRKPRAFTVDDPAPKTAAERSRRTADKPRKPAAIPVTVAMTMAEDDPFLPPPPDELDGLTPPPASPRPRRLTAGKLLTGSLGFLAALALGIWTDTLIRSLFDRLPWLGWAAAMAAAIAVVALLALAIKEFIGIRRLTKVASLREAITARVKSATAKEARALGTQVTALVAANPLTAHGRKSLNTLDDEIIDGPHYLEFAERELMSPLDRQARQLIVNAARRVSVVTAVSPRALVDLAYVGYEAIRLTRAMAELYGGRPGTLGMIRLFRDVIAHLAVTGAIAAGDSLIQQVVGHGLAAKLSARLGEGVINGLMTARIGISAMDLCRPMPFTALKRPGIGDFMSVIAGMAAKDASTKTTGNETL